MSLFRIAPSAERRDINMSDWIRGLDTSVKTKAGVTVTPENASKAGAVWSSVHLLATIMSNLPVDVFRGSGTSKSAVSPQPSLVASPSMIVTRRQWIYQAMTSLLLRGNAYGYILERDWALRPQTVEWLPPSSVEVKQKSALHLPTYKVGGEEVSRDDMIHMRAFVRAGSAVGLSPIEWHAETIGVSLAAQQFGGQWFGDGGHPSALFQNTTQKLDPDATAKVKDRFLAMVRGKREPMVLGSDWNYTPLQVSANESQFLETMGYSDATIARLYSPGLAEILGYETGGSMTYSNRVDRGLDLLTYGVVHWVNAFEDMLSTNIAQPQTVRFNVSALLRMDPKAQMEMFRTAREIGLYNIDEERGLLDLPPLPDKQGEDYTPLKIAKPETPTGEADGNE